MSLPTPIYLLLTNPSWGSGGEDYAQVLAGVRGHWQFDANETHDGKPLAAQLLGRWHKLRKGEALLVDIVDGLVRRGADPKVVLQPPPELHKVNWHYYAGVQSYLEAASQGLDMDQALLGARLACLMGQELGTAETRKQMEALLKPHGGWQTPIHGIPAVAWLGLQVCQEGGTGGWSGSHTNSTSEYFARQIRQMRALATAAKPQATLDEASGFALASSMLLAASYTGRTQSEGDAAGAIETQALAWLEKTPEHEWVALFQRTVENAQFHAPKWRMRLAVAAIRGLTPHMEPTDAWGLIGAALPHLYDQGRYLGSKDTLDDVLDKELGLPDASFFAHLPATELHHDALLRMFTGQFRKTVYGEHVAFRASTLDMLDEMVDWAGHGGLAVADVEFYSEGNPGLRNNAPAMAKLAQYADRLLAHTQGHRLDTHTPHPTSRASSRRI